MKRLAFLADAATLPEMHGRGLQSALLRYRSVVAAQACAKLVYGHTEFGSTSHRDMEPIGLCVLFSRPVWTRTG